MAGDPPFFSVGHFLFHYARAPRLIAVWSYPGYKIPSYKHIQNPWKVWSRRLSTTKQRAETNTRKDLDLKVAPTSIKYFLDHLPPHPGDNIVTCPCYSDSTLSCRHVVTVPSRTNTQRDSCWFPCATHHLCHPLGFLCILKELRGEGWVNTTFLYIVVASV